MAELETFSQFAHRYDVTSGKTLDGQQRLMLLRSNARPLGGIIAETQELSQGVAKCGEVLVLSFGKCFTRCHRTAL